MPGRVNGVNGLTQPQSNGYTDNIRNISHSNGLANGFANTHDMYNSDGVVTPNGSNGSLEDPDLNSTNNGNGIQGLDDGPNDTDMAIVGMACRLPGDVRDPADLWDLVSQGRSGHCKIPLSRFNIEGWYHPDPKRSGCLNMEGGYFLKEDISQFENRFFGINNKEAASMDPQQRKLLEITFECFENAGLTLEACAGANIGCYVGSFSLDYLTSQTRDIEQLSRFSATGLGTTILSNRISHVFDLRGPSVVLDTACSSSLYSLHVACSALRNRECDGALVAAANLIQSPEQQMLLAKAGVLSPTSQCHTFDESADGYGRGEGVGALYIKRLSDAIRDGDPVRAVIRGTAVNSNGKTQGISQPSAKAQEAVIRKAYAQAGNLDPRFTNYVECHGTGTQAGDPVELAAISKVFSPTRDSSNPLLVGSVKTNIGHGEAVSGISAIIKTVMAFERNSIPPNHGIKKLNPKIPFSAMAIDVVTSNRNWPSGIKRAGINSFGYGGANAHAILEAVESVIPYYHQHREYRSQPPRSSLRTKFLLPISASNEAAMSGTLQSIRSANKEYDLLDLAYTLGTKRSRLQSRGFLVADRKHGLQDSSLIYAESRRSPKPLAFIFTGQGAQWPQMGKELMTEFPSFLRTIRELDDVLQRTLHPPDWTLEDLILAPKETSQIHHVTRSQPICTAVQIGLLRLLHRGAVRPSVVVGHSSGEIGAAFAAGLITAAEAIVVAYYRGYVIDKSNAQGSMMAVGLGEDDALSCINDTDNEGAVVAACFNSPSSTTLSGDERAIDTLIDHCNASGVFARKLMTGGKAYHSHHMFPIGKELERLITQAVQGFSKPKRIESEVIMLSSVTEGVINGRPLPNYWRQNMESPVRFYQAVKKLISTGDYHFIEIGPHSALEQPIKAIVKESGHGGDTYPYHSAMIRSKDSAVCFLNLIGNLFLHWHPIVFEKINEVESHKDSGETTQGKLLTDLCPYRWTYDDTIISESRISKELRGRKNPTHDLLGSVVPGFDGVCFVWRNILSSKTAPWLLDHKVGKSAVFSSSAFIAMALEAVCQTLEVVPVPGKDAFTLRDLSLQNMLPLPREDETTEIFLKLWRERITAYSTSNRWFEFEVTSYSESSPMIHCSGKVSLERDAGLESIKKADVSTPLMDMGDPKLWYGALERNGITYGPSFLSMRSIKTHRNGSQLHAYAKTPLLRQLESQKYPESRYIIHPTTIEAGIQLALVAAASGDLRQVKASVPVSLNTARLWYRLGPWKSCDGDGSIIRAASVRSWESDVTFRSQSHQSLIEISGISLVNLEVEQQKNSWAERHPCLRISWKPDFTRLEDPSFSHFLSTYESSVASDCEAPSFKALCAALEVLAHKNSRMRILEMGRGCTFKSQTFMKSLRSGAAVKMYKTYAVGEINSSGEISFEVIHDIARVKGTRSRLTDPKSAFNLIIIPEKSTAHLLLPEKWELLQAHLLQGGVILFNSSPSLAHTMQELGSVVPLSEVASVFMVTKTAPPSKRTLPTILIEPSPKPSTIALSIMAATPTTRIDLSDVNASKIPERANLIMAVEQDDPFLSSMTDAQMNSLKVIAKNAGHILWLTGRDIISGSRPDFGLVLGFARALMLEQPGLRFSTFATGEATSDMQLVAKHTVSILDGVDSEAFPEDLEFAQHKGLLHVSRFEYDDLLNTRFQEAMGRQTVTRPLKEALPAKLKFRVPGVAETVSFEQMSADLVGLRPDDVEIDVISVVINPQDTDHSAGRVHTTDECSATDYSGIVRSVGSSVAELVPGDRVVVMAPGNIKTIQRCPAWACHKMLEHESFENAASLPTNFATAIHALEKLADLQQDQTVLIHSGASSVGIAAIQVARAIGAEIFTTVSTAEERHLLRDTFSIASDHIISLHGSSFVTEILSRTEGQGVDVILNTLAGDGYMIHGDSVLRSAAL